MKGPSLTQILSAKKVIDRYLPHTPLHHWSALSEKTGAQIYLKHENHSPIGSFKARGALNSISALPSDVRAKGVVTCSTGNHGQAVAYAGYLLGIPATVFVPENCNPDKVAAIRRFGGEPVLVGRDFDDAKPRALALAEERGLAYIDDGRNMDLIAANGTLGLEILQDLPDVEVVVVPVGGGALISGCATAIKRINPAIRVIGVQPELSSCMYLSWKAGKPVSTPSCETFADGLATRVPTEIPLGIMAEVVDDMVLVSEEDMERAIMSLWEGTHNLAEGSGAAALAACVRYPELVRGKKTAALVTGGNLHLSKLQEIIGKY